MEDFEKMMSEFVPEFCNPEHIIVRDKYKEFIKLKKELNKTPNSKSKKDRLIYLMAYLTNVIRNGKL